MQPIDQIPLEAIEHARECIAGAAIRTPLVPLDLEDAPAKIYLKLENLQPIGSFKIRGSFNAMAQAEKRNLADGVYTASAGNMAQGVAWSARQLGVPCRVIVPDHAPRTKIEAIERLGGHVIKCSFADWWQVFVNHGDPDMEGLFIHPVSNPEVIAGNGTIGLEILEDLPDVDAVVAPFGGGGLSCGIASAIRALKPNVPIYAAEVETAAPLAASLAAGEPRQVDHTPSFVDGIGGKGLLPEMWDVVRSLLAGSIVVTPEEVAAAIRLLVERNRVIAEGAGAASVAAARRGLTGHNKLVCVVSGGNIEPSKLAKILAGEIPD